MNNVQYFDEYINENNRSDLYHTTHRLFDILMTDQLNTNKPAFSNNNKNSISLSRDKSYSADDSISDELKGVTRIVLDGNKLYNAGIMTKPVDELGIASKGKFNNNPLHYKNRIPTNKLNIDKPNLSTWMEPEREERIYKEVKNLGKYIKAIEFSENYYYSFKKDILIDYLEKYPHIELRIIKSRFNHKYYDIVDVEKLINKDKILA